MKNRELKSIIHAVCDIFNQMRGSSLPLSLFLTDTVKDVAPLATEQPEDVTADRTELVKSRVRKESLVK